VQAWQQERISLVLEIEEDTHQRSEKETYFTQTSIELATFVEYHPVSSLSDGAPIEFEISSSGDNYIDFNDSQLHVKIKILKADGSPLGVGEKVGPINNTLHSLFSQVDVSLNGTQITDSSNTYSYRAYIEDLLSFGSEAKKSQLTCGLFYKDEAGKMDLNDPTSDPTNAGLKKRAAFTARSRVVDLVGRLHTDIFFQSRYMLNEVNTRIKLTRSKDSFCLISSDAEQYKIKIVSAVMRIRKVKISPSIYLAHAKVLESGLAKYPIRRVICKTFTVPMGYLDFIQEKLFSGQLPTRLIIGCVDNKAFNGDYRTNPYNFQNFNATEIAIYLDGQQSAIKPLVMDYANNLYINAYMGMYSGTRKENSDEGNGIDRSEFANGYTLYVFDLTPDLSENDSFNLIRNGGVRLAMKFATALPSTITIVASAEFENIIEIDRNRNVIFDYGQ
jgi:hypothetical protein